MSQKKQFSVKFKMFQHDEVIIFASIMAQSRFFLTSFILLLSGWVAVGLGLNDSASNWIHHFCNHTTDNFFIHFSWLAEWLLIILAILTGFYFNPKRGLVFGIGFGIQSIFVAIVKTWFNAPRPIEAKFFQLRHIENLEIHHWQSFPSGHTAVAFFCMGLIAISIKNLQNSTVWGITCALFAAGIGYSRIYLGQHFLFDVCAGGTIAILFLQLSYQYSKKLGYDV
jgi:membrane-associated phospholipid phosphatase